MEDNDLKNLSLPAFLVADLYRKVLLEPEINMAVEAEPAKKQSKKETAPSLTFHGTGKNGVILILDDENGFESDTRPFLYKMISACKINPEDTAIITTRPAPSLQNMEGLLKIDKVVLFGIEPSEIKLPINFSPFKVQNYGGKSYLHVPGIAEIHGDSETHVANKKELWASLKKMFNL